MIDSTLWYLYGNDLKLAQQKLNLAILKRETKHEKLRLINLLTYIGDYEGCSSWLTKTEGITEIAGQQSHYRILRHRKINNPWQALIGSHNQHSLDTTLKRHIVQGNPISVDLVGGIGDQIENAAVLMASKKNIQNSSALLLRPTGENYKIVRQLLEQVPNIKIEEERGEGNTWHVTAPWFRFWLNLNKLEEPPRTLLEDKSPSIATGRVLACWRSKVDQNNKLSSYSRSIPFREIAANYERLGRALREKKLEIYDISSYSKEEEHIIRSNNPSVRLMRAEIKNLLDTRRLMRKCSMIITVDTSLVHLAAASGRNVDLLLNKFPDERWQDLCEKGSSYAQHVMVHQQKEFHRWNEPLETIRQKIVAMSQHTLETH